MQRRTFAKLGASGLFFPISGLQKPLTPRSDGIEDLIDSILLYHDSRIQTMLLQQVKDPDHKWYGGIPNKYGIFAAGHASGFIRNLTCAYISPRSGYYKSDILLESMKLASEYLLKAQYEDGTIDLPTTNFHSPPDTAFVVEPLCIAYSLLDKIPGNDLLYLKEILKKFLLRAGEALSVGGIHTANHRWVVCMALTWIHALFPDEKYPGRMEQWLAEGIDIDQDGQYSEKSAMIYTPLVNRCLITIARLAKRPELLDYVRKNLEITLFCVHTNGEIVTETSGRQDQYQRGTMENYWYAYRYMAILDLNGTFASMVHQIEGLEPEKLVSWLPYIMEDSFLSKPLPVVKPLSINYVKRFSDSGMLRIRRDQKDVTLLSGNPVFFTFCKGKAVLESIRLATAFFGKGQFAAEDIVTRGGYFELNQHLTGPYYQPLKPEEIPADGNGWQVPRSLRAKSEVQEQAAVVKVREVNQVFEMDILIEGTDHVPVALELAFRKGGRLAGVEKMEEMANVWLAGNEKMMKYEFGGDEISFGPGLCEHSWTQLRGALPRPEADCVYLTGFTPFHIIISIS